MPRGEFKPHEIKPMSKLGGHGGPQACQTCGRDIVMVNLVYAQKSKWVHEGELGPNDPYFTDQRPHSRACGTYPHQHGANTCSSNCVCNQESRLTPELRVPETPPDPTARELINELTKLDPTAYDRQPRPAHRATPNDNLPRPSLHIMRPLDMARAMSASSRNSNAREADGQGFWLVLARELEAQGYYMVKIDDRE